MENSISEFKQSLKWLPKEEKVNRIKQTLINRGLSRIPSPGGPSKRNVPRADLPTDKQLEELMMEIESNVEAYESNTKRKELIPFMYDRDLNWFFNVKNIPAQQSMVMPTYDYFNEGPGNGIFEPLDFLNLLWKQHEDLLKNCDRPFDIMVNLKSIPVNDHERHIVFGFILKWFGGYPINNRNEQCNTVLKLIEKEFLKFPEHTPEKEFCGVDLQGQRDIREVMAHLGAEMKGVKIIGPNEPKVQTKYNFKSGNYINKVAIDFEDLPKYVIENGIISRFEGERMNRDVEYYEWREKILDFLNSIPDAYRLKAITKGIEYGQKVYKYHLDKECSQPQDCPLNQSWDRRIGIAQSILRDAEARIEVKTETIPEPTIEKNKEFTTARQVLALHFIFEQLQVRSTEIDRSVKAKFVEFLTGKNYKNIYDALEKPFITKEKNFRFEDLKFIRNYFETLGLSEIVKAINNQLEKPK